MRSTSRLRRDLLAINADGAFWAFMVGCGESWLVAFSLALGHGAVLAGLMATLPMLVGALLQLSGPGATRALASNKRWVVWCALAQALGFLPLVYFAYRGELSAFGLFLCASFYWATGLAGGPAWNLWTGTVVPPRLRARYFGRRTRLLQAATMAGLLGGGLVLALLAGGDPRTLASVGSQPLWPFALLFGAAAICRFASAWWLGQQSEPQPVPLGLQGAARGDPFERLASAFDPLGSWDRTRTLLRRLRHSKDGRLILYLFLAQFGAQFGAPFFHSFVLQHAGHGYAAYMALLAIAFAAKLLCAPLLGEYARAHGPLRLLWLGGAGIVPLSLFWMLADNLPWLLLAQACAGIAWCAFELGSLLLFFDEIEEEQRTRVLTLYNLSNAVAMALGSLAGGQLLLWLGGGQRAYLWVFALSAALRLAPIVLLKQLTGGQVQHLSAALRLLSLRPLLLRGGVWFDRPLVPLNPRRWWRRGP